MLLCTAARASVRASRSSHDAGRDGRSDYTPQDEIAERLRCAQELLLVTLVASCMQGGTAPPGDGRGRGGVWP